MLFSYLDFYQMLYKPDSQVWETAARQVDAAVVACDRQQIAGLVILLRALDPDLFHLCNFLAGLGLAFDGQNEGARVAFEKAWAGSYQLNRRFNRSCSLVCAGLAIGPIRPISAVHYFRVAQKSMPELLSLSRDELWETRGQVPGFISSLIDETSARLIDGIADHDPAAVAPGQGKVG